jgi:quercetin dioxygenase-like cupin family protein
MDEAIQTDETTAPPWRRAPVRSNFASFAGGFLLALVLAVAWTGLKPLSLKADSAPYPTSEVFLGNQTIIGQTIAYPAGVPMVHAVIVPLAPGGQSAWHVHQTPLFGFILEGELTVDYGSKGTRVYRAGEAVLEAIDWPHQASNRGSVQTRVLAVNIGIEGGAFAGPATGPQ